MKMKKKFLWILSLLAITVLTFALSIVTAMASVAPVVHNSDQLVESGKLYDNLNGGKLTPVNGVVASSGDGHIIYEAEVDGVDLNLRATSGNSIFFVLRGNDEKAVWDGGHGYFLMLNGTANGLDVQLIKGAQTGTSFTVITSALSEVDFFDGEIHNVKYIAQDVESKVVITLAVDGEDVLTAEDTENVYEKAGSHFFICSGSSNGMWKIYASYGEDVDVSTVEVDTITSKTMLSKASNWVLDGTLMVDGSIVGNRDQSKAIFNRELKNVLYAFDLKIDDIGQNWIAIYLNTSKADVPWNDGFRSIVLFVRESGISVEYWNPQRILASVDFASYNITLDEKLHIETGLYDVELSSGKFTYVKIAVNGIELYNAPILDTTVSLGAGYFGILNYGTAKYTLSATDYEMDELPSATTGTKVNRADESAMVNAISVEDWAIIANSFNPYYSFEDDVMCVENKGYITYKNSINAEKISFKLKFEEQDAVGQMAEFAFGKKTQKSIVDVKLADDYTNYGYMLRVSAAGNITVVKTDNGGNMRTLMTYDTFADFGITFEDLAWHTLTVYRSLENGQMKISLFIDGEDYGYYTYDTDYYAPNYPMDGFISFGNTTSNSKYFVKDIIFEGTETDVASTLKADAVNFVTYFEEDGKEFVYFCFDSASYTTKWVEIYASDKDGNVGEMLGRVFPKNTTFDVTQYDGEYVVVKSVGFTEAGSKTTLLKLEEKAPTFENTSDVKRITIKKSDSGAYFAYAGTNDEFIPVGGNYMGLRGGDHSTFDAATSFTEADYDPVKAEAMIRALSENYGNVIRVFLIGRTATNPGISGDPAYSLDDENYYYEGLYKPYMENVAHFLRVAQKYGVYVMLTLGDADVPSNDYYISLQGGAALARNYMYFDARGVNARKTYAKNVMKYFTECAPDCVSGIFSIELQNEFAVHTDQWPFIMTSGMVQTANGKTYDMGDADSRELCYKEGVTYYINQVYSAIKSVDNKVLVNEGTFTRNIVGNNHVYGMQNVVSGDYRMPATFDIYLNTNIDFLDVHIYYANTSGNTVLNSFADDLTYMNFWTEEVQELMTRKPIFMGEFGPNARVFPNVEDANNVWTETVRLAAESGFKGFAVWTLESHNQTECWNVLADDGKFDLFIELVSIFTGEELSKPGESEGENGGDDSGDIGGDRAEDSTSSTGSQTPTDSSNSSQSTEKKGCGGYIAGGQILAMLALCALGVMKKRED